MKPKLKGILLLLCMIAPGLLHAQVITGKVISAADNLGLPSASVVEVDANKRIINATITDVNGEYVLKVKNPGNNLVFSFIGFVSKTEAIGERRTINVELQEERQQINEVVITADRKHDDGTFAIPQREVSTAVQTISTKSFEGVQVTSIDDALQGRVAGLDIVANSGDLGAGTTMRIRGATSINSNNEPLIVLNGVPYEVAIDPSFDFASANEEQYANMLSINPDDIEEITVLKDASSTAVWGAKGANGVLVIKTKKGVRGPTRVQYSYRLTGAVQPRGMNMLSGDDYTMLMKQAYFNPNQDENAANVREFLYDPTYSEYENFNNNTDWVKEVTQPGFKNDHYLTISGGGERARFRISGGYLSQTGTVIGQKMDRISSRAYLDYSVSDRIKFITEFSYTYTDNIRNYDNLLGIAYRKMPNVSVYQQDLEGNDTDVFYNIPRTSGLHSDQRDLKNPVALAYQSRNTLANYRIIPTFRLQYDLLDPEKQTLRYSMYVTFDVNNDKTSKFMPREATNNDWFNEEVNLAQEPSSESMTVLADNNITWQPKFNNSDHNLMLYASFQISGGNGSNMGIATANLPSMYLIDATNSGYLADIYTNRYNYRSNAVLARGHYSFRNKYILGFTIRRDGNTRFGDNNKYGNFPGVSAKWIISDESFMQATDRWLSMLAFRVSWGKSGNPPSEEYLHFSRYSSYTNYLDLAATRPTSLKLADLRWETTTSLNYGLDLAFLNNRFVFDLNFYNKRTEDLLFPDLGIPSSSGFYSVSFQNGGTMDNDGWELNFSTNRGIEIGDFRWDFNFNLSNYVNTIIELDDNILNTYNGDFNYNNGSYLSRIQEGNSFGSIYGFRYLGVYQYDEYIPGVQEDAPVARDENGNVFTDEDGNPLPMYFAYGKSNAYEFQGGDAKYEDINNDGSIDELDIVYLGNSNPKVNGGFGSNIRYKNFGCNIFFNFRYGNKIVNAARMDAENMYTLNNQSTAVNWRWRKDGDETEIPRALYRYGYNWLGSDRFVEDGSFVRLKYLTFNYSLPREKLSKYNIQQLSFYLTINNIFALSSYTGVDPEVGYGSLGVSMDRSATPRSKDATLGVSIVF